MPDIYVREKDKQDEKIRKLEKEIIAIQNDNLVLRQRVGVLEDKFSEQPAEETITIISDPPGTPITSSDASIQPEKKSRKPRAKKAVPV